MHKDDTMAPGERISNYLAGKEVDRVPLVPMLVTLAGRPFGMTHREKRSSAKAQVKAQVLCYERFGHDLMLMEYGLHGVGKVLGSKFSDPEDAVPAIMDWVMKDIEDYRKLDPEKARIGKDPHLRMQVESVQEASHLTKGEVPSAVTVSGPFTAAASLFPTEKLLRSMVRDPEKLHELLRFCTEILKHVSVELTRAGGIVCLCDPVASSSILRRKHYLEFVQPYTREIFQAVHEAGGSASYHMCGDTTPITEDMVDTGCDMLSIDNVVDLAFACEKVGERVCILGNVEPVNVMLLGKDEDVDFAVKSCFAKAWNNPKGFMLATGCDVPLDAPVENVESFMRAGRKYGKWPLDPQRYGGCLERK